MLTTLHNLHTHVFSDKEPFDNWYQWNPYKNNG